MILCSEEYAKKIDSAVFPGQQGGPLEHVIAGKAVAFKIAATELFRERQRRTRRRRARRRRASCSSAGHGVNVLTGGTDVHLVLVDLRDVRARRPAGRGPPARRSASPSTATPCRSTRARRWSSRPAHRHAGARHARPAGRRLRARSARSSPRALTPDVRGAQRTSSPSASRAIAERYPLYAHLGARDRRGLSAPRRRRACARAVVRPPRCDAVCYDAASDRARRALRVPVAAAVAALLTPLTVRLARAVGAIDEPRERGLSERPTPLLGGLAIFAGVLVAALICAAGRLGGRPAVARRAARRAASSRSSGALDDRFDLHAAGQARRPVRGRGDPRPLRRRGRRRSRCRSSAPAFRTLGTNAGRVADGARARRRDERRQLLRRRRRPRRGRVRDHRRSRSSSSRSTSAASTPGVLAAITAGAALGFLVHNFHPASIFMGDCGANLLGLLLGCVVGPGRAEDARRWWRSCCPLILLAVPFLDTTFVVLKRMKYRQPGLPADAEHFHHRFGADRLLASGARSLYLYAWTLLLAGARARAALRALQRPPRPPARGLDARDGRARRCSSLAASVVPRLRARDPQVPAPGRDAPAPPAPRRLSSRDRGGRRARTSRPANSRRSRGGGRRRRERARGQHVRGAEQRVGERQVDQDGVGAEQQRGGAQAPVAADGG